MPQSQYPNPMKIPLKQYPIFRAVENRLFLTLKQYPIFLEVENRLFFNPIILVVLHVHEGWVAPISVHRSTQPTLCRSQVLFPSMVS